MAGIRSRLLRRAATIAVTAGVIGISIGGVVAGQAALSQRAADRPAPAPAPATAVETFRVAMQDRYAVERRFAGQFEPRRESALAFEEGGRVAHVHVREGDRVRAGDVIAALDTALLDAEHARLSASRDGLVAEAELARRTDARQTELRERGFATDETVDDTSLRRARAEAGIAEIDASIAALDVRLDKAVIRAPFDGSVGERLLDEGTIASPGAAVASLLEGGPVRFRAGLDPRLAQRMGMGDDATVVVEGAARPATLARLAPELDPATRTQAAFFDVEGPPPPSRASGEVVLRDTVPADPPGAWVPLAALRQGVRGTWDVLTVDDASVAGLATVEVVHADGDRAFVRGTLRDGARVVADGPHRVVPGERVRILDGTSNPEDVAWAR